MAEAAPLSQLHDRRSLSQPLATISLFADRLEMRDAEKLIQRIALSEITSVRMAVEMAGQGRQIICQIRTDKTEMKLGSQRPLGVTSWENNAVNFRQFLLDLHEILITLPQPIRYVEGQSLKLRLIITAVGLAMIIGGIGFGYWAFLDQGLSFLTLMALPFMALGGMMASSFRPSRPFPYDPKGLIENFKNQIERAKDHKDPIAAPAYKDEGQTPDEDDTAGPSPIG